MLLSAGWCYLTNLSQMGIIPAGLCKRGFMADNPEEHKYDISIIRPQMRADDVRLRRESMSPARLKAIKKALHAFHTLETMAVNIYKFQITKGPSELNRQLIAAMCNEMTHLQDFQVKLFEFGFKPSIFRIAYWFVGFAFGFCSCLLGKTAILKVGVWVESKAVKHYDELLKNVDWDEQTRRMIEKDQADEDGHISRWKKMLAS
jgi:demethoxyubiquinone hydroxylase (CLK1/Coq7/Cat5 family)